MKIGQISGEITEAWAVFERELTKVFGQPTRGKGTYRWTKQVLALFSIEVTANKGAGRTQIVTKISLPYRIISTIGTIVAVALIIEENFILATLFALSVCLFLALLPTAQGFFLPFYFYFRTKNIFKVKDFKMTSWMLVPLTGWAIGTIHVTNYWLPSFIMTGFLLTLSIFVSGDLLSQIQDQSFSFLILSISSMPPLITFGNLTILDSILRLQSTSAVVALLITIVMTVLITDLYLRLCSTLANAADIIPNPPTTSRLTRFLWGSVMLGINLFMIIFMLLLLFQRDVFGTTLVSPADIGMILKSVGTPYHTSFGLLTWSVLVSPLMGLLIFWIYNIHNQIKQRHLLSTADELGQNGFEIPVKIVDSPAAQSVAHHRLFGQDTVIVTTALVEQLREDELRALIEHEKYHLNNYDSVQVLIATFFGFLVGGKNALIMLFDFARSERDADLYAADQVGTDTIIRALRRLEMNRTSVSIHQADITGAPAFLSVADDSQTKQILLDTYNILFGNIVLDAAHQSIDDRVRYILDA